MKGGLMKAEDGRVLKYLICSPQQKKSKKELYAKFTYSGDLEWVEDPYKANIYDSREEARDIFNDYYMIDQWGIGDEVQGVLIDPVIRNKK